MPAQSATPHFEEQRYNVFKVRYTLAIADPDVPGPRYHNVIFVETGSEGSGFIHHVTGDLVNGMQYQHKNSHRPQDSQSYHDRLFLGTVLASSYPAAVDDVCRAQPAPPRQKAFNIRTMKTEPIKPDGSFYSPNEPRLRLVKCTEWTENQVIPALLQAGVVKPGNVTGQDPPRSAASSSHAGVTESGWVWDEKYGGYRRLQDGKWVWA